MHRGAFPTADCERTSASYCHHRQTQLRRSALRRWRLSSTNVRLFLVSLLSWTTVKKVSVILRSFSLLVLVLVYLFVSVWPPCWSPSLAIKSEETPLLPHPSLSFFFSFPFSLSSVLSASLSCPTDCFLFLVITQSDSTKLAEARHLQRGSVFWSWIWRIISVPTMHRNIGL